MLKNLQGIKLLFLLVIFCTYLNSSASAGSYKTLASTCDGLAQLPLVTIDGLCVGLVAQRDAQLPFKMPRTLVELEDGKLLVVDMGGWTPNKGKLWLVDYKKSKLTATAVLSDLNLPHKILYGPAGKIYLAEAQRIQRFSWNDGKITRLETVIDNLPFHSEYLHPLKNFTFDNGGNLLVNIGSSSDRCEKKIALDDCISGAEASVRRYSYDTGSDAWNSKFKIIARGLRNSMVLVPHTSGTVLQAENSIDFPDADEPYEEINLLEQDGFFGWPICYNRTASVNKKKCTAQDYREPWTLLPPHVAPLDAIYYRHTKLAPLNNKLLMSWHGYRITGNRLVAFAIDEMGRPIRQPKAWFKRAPQSEGGGHYTRHDFAPKGELGLVAQHTEVISQWHEIAGVRAEGAPVGLTQARDGSLFVVDDRNGAILRLSTGIAYVSSDQPDLPKKAEAIVIPEPVNQIFRLNCARCHNELLTDPKLLLSTEKWLQKTAKRTLLEQRIFWEKMRPMPPDKSLSEAEKQAFRDWLQR